ncbi:DctP family TRAP transporter solute-binding subunit [Brevibacterium litoralis]|uniref:DctP family TRAP transporter solute-binding subunit n=1 Tax=Brevibacterium litoralis TaxID=3138935 RepID=UPI0032F01CD6
MHTAVPEPPLRPSSRGALTPGSPVTTRARRRLRSGLATLACLLTLCLLAACGTNFGTTEDGKQRYRWKMTITVGATSTWYMAAERLAENLAEETDGRIVLDVYTNERLSAGNATAGVEQLMDGAKDLSFNSPIIYAGVDPRFGAVTAPFAFDTPAEGSAALEGTGGDLYADLLDEYGVHLLAFGESGMRQLTNSHRPVRSPEDLAGMKFRIPGFGLYTDFYRGLGADPVGMPFSEVFTGLQQGAIDGQENPVDIIWSSSLQEVQPYLTLWNYSYDPLILGMNDELWDSLSTEDQEIVSRLAAEASAWQIETNRANEQQYLEELEEAGMEINTLTPEETASFQHSLTGLYDHYRRIWGPDLSAHFIPEVD